MPQSLFESSSVALNASQPAHPETVEAAVGGKSSAPAGGGPATDRLNPDSADQPVFVTDHLKDASAGGSARITAPPADAAHGGAFSLPQAKPTAARRSKSRPV